MFDACLGDASVGVRVAALKAACSFFQDIYIADDGEAFRSCRWVVLVRGGDVFGGGGGVGGGGTAEGAAVGVGGRGGRGGCRGGVVFWWWCWRC